MIRLSPSCIKVSELIEACRRGDIQLAKRIIGEGISYNCIDEVSVIYIGTFYEKMGVVNLYTNQIDIYISRNNNAIGFLFLTQHTTPLLYVRMLFFFFYSCEYRRY